MNTSDEAAIFVLQMALSSSKKSLELDISGQIFDAVEKYYDTLALLDKAIFILACQERSKNGQIAMDLIIEKKMKYSQRISYLLEEIGDYGVYCLPKYNTIINNVAIESGTEDFNGQFIDFYTVRALRVSFDASSSSSAPHLLL